MYKHFKMEFALALTGAIAGTAAVVYVLISSLQKNILTVPAVLPVFLLLAGSIVFSYTGAFLLNANRKFGGILLIISALATLAAPLMDFLVAWAGLLVFPLTMLSGVLAVAKRQPDGRAPFNQTYINTFDGLK